MIEAEDYGKDLATVQNLVKKHQLLDADVKAHEERVKDLNEQADAFIDSGIWDTENIKEKKQTINERYERSVSEEHSVHAVRISAIPSTEYYLYIPCFMLQRHGCFALT